MKFREVEVWLWRFVMIYGGLVLKKGDELVCSVVMNVEVVFVMVEGGDGR
jgi:hypothetical protein